MKNDGQTYLWIPSILSLSTLSQAAVDIINPVHTALGRPTVTTADTNPYVLLLNDLDMGGAPFTRDDEPNMAVCGPIINMAYLGIDQAALIIAFGGDIEAMSVFFELTEAQLDEAVPAEFPERLDGNGNALTWRTWGVWGESHKPVQYGANWYRSVNYGQAGTPLNASDWMPYRNGGGVVKTLAEYQAIQQANAPQV